MNDNVAIKVNHVSKYFKLPTEPTNSLRRAVVNRFKGIKGYRKQEVLKDISFEIEKGDFFGIVGRNGSGKSTLLKIISKIYKPNAGDVEINGRLVSFIELGVGFNEELSGRENVYLNGAMLGFSHDEIDAMYDEIVEFSELQDFMDQKLKNYSSGMQVRLAFSVAIKAKGDILVLDEVLAVGDEAFQRKCDIFFREIKTDKTKTVILVTHDMNSVRKFCNKAIFINNGLIAKVGNPEEVTNTYSLENLRNSKKEKGKNEKPELYQKSRAVSIVQVSFLSPKIINVEESIKFEIRYEVYDDIKTFPAFTLIDIDNNYWLLSDNSYESMTSGKGTYSFIYDCKISNVNRRKIQLNVLVNDDEGRTLASSGSNHEPFILIGNKNDETTREILASSGLLRNRGEWLVKKV